MLSVIGAGIGSLVALLFSFIAGDWTPALIIGAVAGAAIPPIFMGPPGR